ncbi:MAG: S8 family serine peptidase [bacterium]|nr:S8 family serine peptidase [bacterium]
MRGKKSVVLFVILTTLLLGAAPEPAWCWRRSAISKGPQFSRPVAPGTTYSGNRVQSAQAPNARRSEGTFSNFRPGELIVKVRDELPSLARAMSRNAQNTGSRNLDVLNRQFGVTTVEAVFNNQAGGRVLSESSPLSKVMLLNLGRNVDEKTALRAYASLEEIEYAELNYIYHIFSTPNDPFISSQYGLYSGSSNGIDALGGWAIESGNSSIMIAVIDTGVDYRHEDLSGKVVKGYDFVNEDYDPMDDNGHGTHVAGVAGGIANNGRGIAGVCRDCTILAVKVVTADGAGSNSWIANGIANAVNLGARVLNLSLGGLDNSNTIRIAVEQAYKQGAIIIAASGNDGSGVPMYPAALSETISVGATGRYGDKTSFSNYGNTLELAAPGESIYGTVPGNRYEAWNGTSMASPHVAGAAALLLSRNPALSNTQVRQLLASTATDLGPSGRDSYFGFGRIDVRAALSQVPDSNGNVPNNPGSGGGGNPYPTPSPGGGYLCGPGSGGLFAVTLVVFGLVNMGRLRRRKGTKQIEL